MKKSIVVVVTLLVLGGASLLAGDKPQMSASKTIMENAANSPDLSTLVAAIKAAGLEKVLEGPGPYTLFAPSNEAFADMPKGTVENLMKPENKSQLKKVLEYHIVKGKWTTADLKKKIAEGKGTAELTSLSGEKLRIGDMGKMLMVSDLDDDLGMFTWSDLAQSNGEIDVIDNLMMPKQ